MKQWGIILSICRPIYFVSYFTAPMIISVFMWDTHSNKKVFRSSRPMPSSKMNYFITEFMSLDTSADGVIEKEFYNYVYTSNNVQKFAMQISKDHSIKSATSVLKFIEQNSTEDVFDVLVTIDNTLFDGEGIKMDLHPIKAMDSQEEKIYNMMLENKKLEMIQREKEQRKVLLTEQVMPETKPVAEHKPKKIEKSSRPVLVVIREKIKMEIDKENYIKESTISGEMNLIISDPKYRQVQIKVKNLGAGLKYSPYLDKSALKKQVLRFEKDRGLNKSIPLLKWTGKNASAPMTFEFWNDEDGEKYVNILGFTATKDLKNLEFRFNGENVTDIEVDGEHEVEEDGIVWRVGNVKKGESRTLEIKCCSFDKNALFPIYSTFVSEVVDSPISIERVFVGEEDVTDYEFRKIVDVEEFKILSE